MKEADAPDLLLESLNVKPLETFKGKTDYMLVVRSQSIIENLNPDFGKMKRSGGRGVIVTAKGDEADFVSRFFAPQVGVDEDPVTGSAHTSLIPFWAKMLGKNDLTALQLSGRRGKLWCSYLGNRVEITGMARLFLSGEISI
jgi:predicted PhzF superfamily epimerase YddE/YHI9